MAKLRKKQKGGPGNTVKKIGKELLQTATPINILDIAGLLPANLKAFAADLTGIGKSEGITEKDLNKKEKKALKEAIAKAEKAGKNYIEYFDYNTTGTPKTKNEDIGGGSFKAGLAPITKYFDPSYSMKTMLGQTGFKKNKDGSYTVNDQYDFNDARGAGFKGFIADASKAEGIEKFNPYRVLRSAARNFGSAPGEGMDININLKQAGGLATPPMYGANTMPGSQETAAITYQEADKAKVKALEEELEETRTSTKYMDEAEANIAKQQATIDSIEQSLGQGVEKAEELGVFDKLKARGAQKAADKLGREALAKGTTLAGGVSDDALQALAPKLFEKSITPGIQSATSSLPSNLANFTPASLQFGQSSATSLVPSSMGTQGANLLNTGANVGASAGKGLIGNVGPGGVGAIASLAGEGIKMASDDQDATTMNAGESIGSGLSGIGTGIGAAMTTAALMGTSLGPLGTAAGAIGGAVYGLGKGLISRGKARREMKKAEKKKEKDEQNIASAQKLETLKSRMYSGYDMGADIARYGGYYQMGGTQAQQFLANQQASNQGNQNVQMPADLLPGIKKRMNTPMSEEDRIRYGSLQMQRDASDYLAKEGTMAGFKGPEETSALAKTGKFVAKEALLDKAFHGLGRFAGLPGLMLSPMEASASTVRDPYGVPMRKPVVKNRDGGVKLPGGMAKPIPGSDAIEFKGRSHEQGGIMIDPNTEVEGDETMDKVTMKNGGKNDYFFSQHLKLGGKSFAQRHKDLLKNGGTQGEIDYLAKLQEEKAGRNPDDVKLGAGGYYLDGGEFMDYTQTSYNNDAGIVTQSPFITAPYNPTLSMNDIVPQAGPTREEINHENMINKGFVFNTLTGTYTKPSKEPESESAPVTNSAPEERVPDENFEFNFMEPKPIPVPDKMVYDPNKVDAEKSAAYDNLPQEDKNIIDKANSDRPLTKLEERALRRLRRNVPALAIGAGIAQMIPAAYAFFRKDKPAEQMGAPGRIKAPSLDRVSFNAERASNAAQSRAISRSIDTSGAGPAGIMAKMASYRQKQEGDIKIAAQEARMNTAIANQEAQMQTQTTARNVANAMNVDQVNTGLREAERIAQINKRMEAIDTTAQNLAGLAGDALSYKATERLARATGDQGVYERDRLRNFLKNTINPNTGQPYTNSDIAELFNKRFGEVQATNEPKDKDDEQV